MINRKPINNVNMNLNMFIEEKKILIIKRLKRKGKEKKYKIVKNITQLTF